MIDVDVNLGLDQLSVGAGDGQTVAGISQESLELESGNTDSSLSVAYFPRDK